ncbi:uncharacterized [Tachysurus ichikawai]
MALSISAIDAVLRITREYTPGLCGVKETLIRCFSTLKVSYLVKNCWRKKESRAPSSPGLGTYIKVIVCCCPSPIAPDD